MDLIKSCEEKFDKIEKKINSNTELTANIYNNDVEKINKCFETKQEKYENGLNQYRDEMLKHLVEKRNQQLEKVNVFKQKTKLNGLSKLKNLADSIKLSYISFSRSLISVYESILLRTKFGNQLKLFKLVKYFKLMKNEERINLANVGHLLKIELRYYMHILPLNKILL